jgi:hypothetical protein
MSMTFAWLLTAALAISSVGWALRVRHVRRLADTSDEVFADYFRTHGDVNATAALVERKEIAKLLRIPLTKLGPQTSIPELVSPLDPTMRVGLGDLEFDMMRLAKKAGLSDCHVPSNIGELIKLRVDLKAKATRG